MRIWEYVVARLTYRGVIKGVSAASEKGFFTLWNAFLFLFTILVVIGCFIYVFGEMERGNSAEVWSTVNTGDSLFVLDHGMVTFYKKGKTELPGNIQRELKYRRVDTVNFISQNNLSNKFFYMSRTSFVGICTGVDSSITEEGKSSTHKWLIIEPSDKISSPPKAKKDEFGIDAYDPNLRQWYDRTEYLLSTVPLSREFYVQAADVQLANNDSIFK